MSHFHQTKNAEVRNDENSKNEVVDDRRDSDGIVKEDWDKRDFLSSS